MERRFTNSAATCGVETREDGSKVAVGYAAVFYDANDEGTQYVLWRGAVERIAPGAFAEALGRPDNVRALFNHDPDNILGRLAAGTLRLREDVKGLRYEIDLPDTSLGRDLAISLERGDVAGSSFAFVPNAVRWEEEDETDVRTILSLQLYDVGPVTFPAYEATSAGLRFSGTAEAEAEHASWRGSRITRNRLRARMRLWSAESRRG